jgi:hypothetical protein
LPFEKQSLEKRNRFLLTTMLLRRTERTMVKAAFKWSPHIFKVYFGTSLDRSETKV